MSLELLSKHVFAGSDGTAIFLFEPEKAFVENPDGEGFILTLPEDAEVLDFLAIMDGMGLERNEFNAYGLVTVLLERREQGEMEEFA